tara:strand:- start:939 stop:1472 length:534 start_codon:yes stop_codon:yes gene_type:complete
MFEQLAFIDPITAGLIITTGAKAIGSFFGSDKKDTQDTIDASKQLSFAEIKDTENERRFNLNKINRQTESLIDSATAGGQQSMAEIALSTDVTSGFESNEMFQTAVDNTKTEVYDSYGSSVDDIVATADENKFQLNLNTKKQLDTISAELDSNMANAVSAPDTWLERFTGSSNYKVG